MPIKAKKQEDDNDNGTDSATEIMPAVEPLLTDLLMTDFFPERGIP